MDIASRSDITSRGRPVAEKPLFLRPLRSVAAILPSGLVSSIMITAEGPSSGREHDETMARRAGDSLSRSIRTRRFSVDEFVVAARGLEPRHLSAPDPKSGVSANSTKRPMSGRPDTGSLSEGSPVCEFLARGRMTQISRIGYASRRYASKSDLKTVEESHGFHDVTKSFPLRRVSLRCSTPHTETRKRGEIHAF